MPQEPYDQPAQVQSGHPTVASNPGRVKLDPVTYFSCYPGAPIACTLTMLGGILGAIVGFSTGLFNPMYGIAAVALSAMSFAFIWYLMGMWLANGDTCPAVVTASQQQFCETAVETNVQVMAAGGPIGMAVSTSDDLVNALEGAAIKSTADDVLVAASKREFSAGQIIRQPWFTTQVRNRTFASVSKDLVEWGFERLAPKESGRITFEKIERLPGGKSRTHQLHFDGDHWHKYIYDVHGQPAELTDCGYIEAYGTQLQVGRVHIKAKK